MPKRVQFEFREIIFAAALLVLLIQFGFGLLEYARHAQAALTFPFPLDYGEGPILDQVLGLTRLENIYRPDISTPPYTITSYPPLFQLIQVPFAHIFGPAFWYGRAISILSAILAALLIALTVQTLTDDWIAASVSGLMLFTFPYILQGSAFDNVDSLALALSWAGLFTIVRWPDRRRTQVLAVILFTAAIYTKQSYGLVAPFAALIWLWQGKRRRQALWLAGLLGAINLALFLLLNLVTGGGFSFHFVRGIVNGLALQNLLANSIDIYFHAFYLALGSAVFMFLERLGDNPTRTWPLVTPYVLLSAISLIAVGKVGSRGIYLYEAAAALCLAAGAIVAWPNKDSWLKIGLVLALALQVNNMVNWSRSDYIPVVMSKINAASEVEQLASYVRRASGPILADEYMGLIPLSGHRLYFQPYEFWLLSRDGLWDDSAFLTSIQRREVSAIFFYMPRESGLLILERWAPDVRDTIFSNYRLETTLADVLVYVPKE